MKNSKEYKAAVKSYLETVEISEGMVIDQDFLETLYTDAFLDGILWERQRLRPKLSKMYEQVAVSLHIDE